MIVPLPRSRRTSEDNVLPLINIVFLLLIFFMIAGALSTTTPFDLRPARVQAAPDVPAPASSGIAIAGDGRIAFGGDTIGLDALPARLERWQAEREDDKPLVVRADAQAGSERLLAVIDALREAGVGRVRLLATGDTQASP